MMYSFSITAILIASCATVIPSASGFAARDASSRTRRPPPNRTRRKPPSSSETVERKRAPHQFDHTKEEARPFLDNRLAVKEQLPNDDAPLYTFEDDDTEQATIIPEGTHLMYLSLDELFPDIDNLGLSHKFCTDSNFRNDLRNAMREDIFDSTPAYENMSEKARQILLLPDSSLQGSWRCKQDTLRMKKLTEVLKQYIGEDSPTGDEFMEAIGALCGSEPSSHWIDIVGVMNRRIPHSWHQDTGRSRGGDTKTVLLGFPKEDNYSGVGVFSHAVKLKYEKVSSKEHALDDPVVFSGLKVAEDYIVRPLFEEGKEIVLFRDVDVIHSSPDVAYRSSVMRFM
ncbi:hypothetical protein ACHAWT_003171 [Skeletonema menzelii]